MNREKKLWGEKLWELVLYLAAALFFACLARGIWLIAKHFSN